MKYIEESLGMEISYGDYEGQDGLPYFLSDGYRLQVAHFPSSEALFVYPKRDIESLSAAKKHMGLLSKKAEMPAVLILSGCTARQRKALIEARIPFVVDNKQIYLPFLGTYLRESYSHPEKERESLSPSAQLLFFCFLYEGCNDLPMAGLSNKLGITPMSVTRAVKELESLGLVSTYKKGVNKIVSSPIKGQKLYDKASALLRSPVKKEGYVDRDILENPIKAGLTALSEMSRLNPPEAETYAVKRLPKGCSALEETLSDSEKQVRVQVWSYDPSILGKENRVDALSLYQTLKEHPDERVQAALSEIMR